MTKIISTFQIRMGSARRVSSEREIGFLWVYSGSKVNKLCRLFRSINRASLHDVHHWNGIIKINWKQWKSQHSITTFTTSQWLEGRIIIVVHYCWVKIAISTRCEESRCWNLNCCLISTDNPFIPWALFPTVMAVMIMEMRIEPSVFYQHRVVLCRLEYALLGI